MPITLNGDTGIQTPMYNGTITANAVTPSVNMKNRIINGAMTINQRGFSGTANTAGGYGLDRFAWRTVPSLSAFSISQSTDAPAGFANSMLITSLASTSVGSGDYYTIGQQIEASNAYDFAFGTANAKSITLSFWVKSSLTGTFAGGLNEANSGSVTYGFTYSIPVANTWTYISIPVSGATIGTWNTSTLNSYFLVVNFSLGVGSNESTASNNSWLSVNRRTGTGGTNLVSTNGATFYLTGVQLEVGSTATSFDYRPYGTELQLCMRYAQQIGQGAAGRVGGTNYVELGLLYAVPMRAGATISFGFVGAQNKVSEPGFGDLTMTAINAGPTARTGAYLVPTVTGGTNGRIALILSGDAFLASAEL